MSMRRNIKWAIAATCLAGKAQACAVALALAVDISGSVDPGEYTIQMGGLAAALRDGSVADALVRAEAAIALIHWTGENRQIVAVPWVRIGDHDDVADLANLFDATPRRWQHFSTAIGMALRFTRAQFAAVPDCRRKVIDVSGDGISNEGPEPGDLRSQLWAEGFTVNALAIETDDEDLTAYYWENVIVGDMAFVMTASGFRDYPDRIRLKLLREVTEQLSLLEGVRPPR